MIRTIEDLKKQELVSESLISFLTSLPNTIKFSGWSMDPEYYTYYKNYNDAVMSFEKMFSKDLLPKTFNEKLLFVYDDILYDSTVNYLHTWLSEQVCNIENIIILSTPTYNLSEWYQKFCNLNLTKGFKIIDGALVLHSTCDRLLKNYSIDKNKKCQNLNFSYYFDWYGGTKSDMTRDFLTCWFGQFDPYGYLEYSSGFVSTVKEFDQYLERITSFSDRQKCDDLLAIRKTINLNHTDISNFDVWNTVLINNNDIGKKCAFHIMREPGLTFPWILLTEKVLKNFLDMRVPLPIGFKSITALETLGFKFDHNLIDYSYQNEPIFYNRLVKLSNEIYRIINNYTLEELSKVFNYDVIQHNYDWVINEKYKSLAIKQTLKQLNSIT